MNRRAFVASAACASLSLPREFFGQPVTSCPLKLIMNLRCNKTTEAGADEVYVLIYGRSSDGKTYFRRAPGEAVGQASGHWDMNDGDQPTDNSSGDSRIITQKELINCQYNQGQTWNFTVMIMEEDGGSSRDYQAAAAALAQKVPNPIVAGAGVVLGALTALGLYANDSDDYIGSFYLTASWGPVSSNWQFSPGDRVVSFGPVPERSQDPFYRQFSFNGDGSQYSGAFGITFR